MDDVLTVQTHSGKAVDILIDHDGDLCIEPFHLEDAIYIRKGDVPKLRDFLNEQVKD